MRSTSRLVAAGALAVAVAVPMALAGPLGHVEGSRPSVLRGLVHDEAARAAFAVAVRAPSVAGERLLDGVRAVGGILASDIAALGRFLWARLALDPRLSENPFFQAHKAAALAGARADEPWDLSWAVPEELRQPSAWRAAVANLPPASVRGAHASPEPGVSFIGWPPVAD